jgi:predicted ester cyclase
MEFQRITHLGEALASSSRLRFSETRDLSPRTHPQVDGKGAPNPMTTTEENKVLFRRTYEQLLNGGDLSVADELVSAEFVNHEAPPGRDRGPESLRGLAAMLRTAFPDLHFEIGELVAEGDTVAGRLRMSGTHEGPLMGTPPTGRSVRQEHMHFVRFRDGKAVEHWGVRDDLGMMRQLGLIPESGHEEEPAST